MTGVILFVTLRTEISTETRLKREKNEKSTVFFMQIMLIHIDGSSQTLLESE